MSISLRFQLAGNEGWPPVGSESIPFEKLAIGYECISVPLFVKDLSVEDVISIDQEENGFVSCWTHVQKSSRSTIWLLRLTDSPPIHECLKILRSLQCNTVGLDDFGCYAVDVPAALPIREVDAVLEMLDEELVAVAYPSMRHPE